MLGVARESAGKREVMRRMLRKWLFIAYIVIGVIVAAGHHFFTHVDAIKPIISAVLAVALWPLVLFGVNLHIK
jgi:uncharacterized membrane protein